MILKNNSAYKENCNNLENIFNDVINFNMNDFISKNFNKNEMIQSKSDLKISNNLLNSFRPLTTSKINNIKKNISDKNYAFQIINNKNIKQSKHIN